MSHRPPMRLFVRADGSTPPDSSPASGDPRRDATGPLLDRISARHKKLSPETQSVVISTEGLFEVLLDGDFKNARGLRTWVIETVLPSLLEHGCFPAPEPSADGGVVVRRDTTLRRFLDDLVEKFPTP